MKKIKQTIGIFSILAGVAWVFSNENSVGVGGALIGFGFELATGPLIYEQLD